MTSRCIQAGMKAGACKEIVNLGEKQADWVI